jgi:luciferase family oxidoreductase group 1
VPVYLLGSSTYSAQLAARKGLPFAFASHFAPGLLDQAIHLYRSQFTPSPALERPYVIVGVPMIAADTTAEALRLSTSPKQRFLKLIRGEPIYSLPPVESMDGLWNEAEREAVEEKFAAAIIGGPSEIQIKLAQLIDRTEADELILTTDAYRHQDRLRSFELAAAALGART